MKRNSISKCIVLLILIIASIALIIVSTKNPFPQQIDINTETQIDIGASIEDNTTIEDTIDATLIYLQKNRTAIQEVTYYALDEEITLGIYVVDVVGLTLALDYPLIQNDLEIAAENLLTATTRSREIRSLLDDLRVTNKELSSSNDSKVVYEAVTQKSDRIDILLSLAAADVQAAKEALQRVINDLEAMDNKDYTSSITVTATPIFY